MYRGVCRRERSAMFDGLFLADSHSREVLAFCQYLRSCSKVISRREAAEAPDRRFCVSSSGFCQIHALVQKEARSAGDDVGAGGRDSDAVVVRRLIGAGPRALGHGGRGLVRVFWARARRLVAVVRRVGVLCVSLVTMAVAFEPG